MEYRCETTSVEGFVQLLACNYLPHGYWFYVTGIVPENKDVRRIDGKLIEKYGIDRSRAARSRRKRLGYANLHYLRHGRFFILIATHGRHRFFEDEARCLRDIRRVPLRFAGYAISYRRGQRNRKGMLDQAWHSHVAIEREHFKDVKALLLDLAVRRSARSLALELYGLPFEPYAPIRRQMLGLLRAINKARKQAGLRSLPHQVLPFRRRVVRPFEPRNRTYGATLDRSHLRPLPSGQVASRSLGSRIATGDWSEIERGKGLLHRKHGKMDGK